jgi:hypothetical protein
MIYNENKEAEIRRSMKNQNIIVDKNRTQLNHNDIYEVTILNLRSLELRFEKVEITGMSEEIVICNDSKIKDSSEDNSLLSEHILIDKSLEDRGNDIWLEESIDKFDDENVNVDDENDIERNENANEMTLEDEGVINQEGGVIDRFRAMIMEGLGKEHWDKDERICLVADKEHLEFFTERTVENVIINEDLKFNLQKAINNCGLPFHIKLEKKTSLLTEPINLPIQKLIYLCEKRKKLQERKNLACLQNVTIHVLFLLPML